MNRRLLIGSAALALCSTLVMAQDAPESLLPPGFDDPAPRPAPRPAVSPAPATTRAPNAPAPARPSVPSGAEAPSVQSAPRAAPAPLPGGLPSIGELEKLGTDELDELLGLKPKFDIPAGAQRSLENIGVLSADESGLPVQSLTNQPAALVRAALSGISGPVVSRWGHILLRRSLASRLASPANMDPVEFAALRAQALNKMGEHSVARAVVQDVDTGNWTKPMLDAAVAAYIGTADIAGACPAAQVRVDLRDDPEWEMIKNICFAFAGQGNRSRLNLNRAFRGDTIPKIDVLLAQRYAGAAGRGSRAVNLEWDEVKELTPWRFALANALGAEIPDNLLQNASPYYLNASAISPMIDLDRQIAGADTAARRGVLSAAAMVDLYSQRFALGDGDGPAARTASRLRDAYVAPDAAARMAAIRDVWGAEQADYAKYVLTAYAAARITPDAALEDDAADLIASMLTAGLDADALTWGPIVPQGSEAWALLALAQLNRSTAVDDSQISAFIDDDESAGQRKSKFLLAGLAGLGRIDSAAQSDAADTLDIDLARSTKWSSLISSAAKVDNQALVAFLAGLGMQGSGWERMTPTHLYHIVSALNRVGLSAEARMIAAEAVARG